MTRTNQNTVNFHQYFYDKNGRRGVIVARVYPDGTFNLGWSLAATKRGDRYDAEKGMEIATARLETAEALGARSRVNDSRTSCEKWYRDNVPNSMGNLLTAVLARVDRMVNPKPVPVVVPTLEDKVNAKLDGLVAALGRKITNANPFSRFQNSAN